MKNLATLLTTRTKYNLRRSAFFGLSTNQFAHPADGSVLQTLSRKTNAGDP
jgi:hypothetical protein